MKKKQSSLFIIPISFGSILLSYIATNEDIMLYPISIFSLLVLSFSYFTIDFVLMCMFYKPKNNIYFFHHILGIISIPIIYLFIYQIVGYLISYLTFEISTPFLYLSKFYYKKISISTPESDPELISQSQSQSQSQPHSQSHLTQIYSILSFIAFVTSFVLVRILYGSYLLYILYPVITSMDFPYYNVILLPLCLQILNYCWFYGLIKMILKKCTKHKNKMD